MITRRKRKTNCGRKEGVEKLEFGSLYIKRQRRKRAKMGPHKPR